MDFVVTLSPNSSGQQRNVTNAKGTAIYRDIVPAQCAARCVLAPHTHKECTSRTQPKCANCGGPHPASYGGCLKKKAATLARTVEQVQGKPPKRHEPPPNPDVVFTNTTDLSQEQSTQSQKTSGNTYAAAAKKKRRKPAGSSPPSKQPQLAPQDPTNGRCRHQPQVPEHDRMTYERQQHGSSEQEITCLLIPLLFAALKAFVRANPSSRCLREVEAVLAMEPFVSASYAPQGRTNSQQ